MLRKPIADRTDRPRVVVSMRRWRAMKTVAFHGTGCAAAFAAAFDIDDNAGFDISDAHNARRSHRR